jgi:L,D-peptidoglycan transpeptidase YkuD (ErfK/YbiS/YcfS/YnhG family)
MNDILIYRVGLGYVADWGAGPRPCAVGRTGIGEKQAEGDGITPIGLWPLRELLYRADRVTPQTQLPARAIERSDGWCDAPEDAKYNRPVQLPYGASAELLWREDALYDLVVVVGDNDDPVVAGKGSAIFLHTTQTGAPTEGCVALHPAHLLEALRGFTPQSRLIVTR